MPKSARQAAIRKARKSYMATATFDDPDEDLQGQDSPRRTPSVGSGELDSDGDANVEDHSDESSGQSEHDDGQAPSEDEHHGGAIEADGIDWVDDLNAPALSRTPSPQPEPLAFGRRQHAADEEAASLETIEDTAEMMKAVFKLLHAQEKEIAELKRWGDKIQRDANNLQKTVEMEGVKGKRLLQWIVMYDARDADDAEHERPRPRRRAGSLKEKEIGWSFEEMFGISAEDSEGFEAKVKRRIGSGREGFEVTSFDDGDSAERTDKPRIIESFEI